MACTTTLPTVSFNDNCQTIKRGQIYHMYTTRATSVDVLSDVTDLSEWTTRIDQDDAVSAANTACKIRKLSGIGELQEGEVSEVEIPLDQTFSFMGNKTLVFEVYDMTAANYAAIIAWRDAGTSSLKIWFEADDQIYGGDSGIDGTLRADLIIPKGRNDLQYGRLTFTTKNSMNAVDPTPFTPL